MTSPAPAGSHPAVDSLMSTVTIADVPNRQVAGTQGGDIVVILPACRMTRAEALAHAAWLVVLAQGEDEFPGWVAAVQGT